MTGSPYGMMTTNVLPFLQGLAKSAEKIMPVNLGMYLGTVVGGNRAPVTEKDFDPATYKALQDAAADHYYRRQSNLSEYGQVLELAKQSGDKERIASAQRSYNHQARLPSRVGYDNYGGEGVERLDIGDWWHAVSNSFTDPNWRAATTIGSAMLDKDRAGNTILTDTYDFNTRERAKDMSLSDFSEYLNQPTMILDFLGSQFAPQEAQNRRPVRVNLGMVKPKRKK